MSASLNKSSIELHKTESVSVRRQVIPGDLRAIAPCRRRFLNFLSEMCLPLGAAESWGLVFNECVANAVRHGSKENPEESVVVEWGVQDNVISLSVTDSGSGPDDIPQLSKALPEDLLAEGGRGFFIIGQLCDEVEHWYSPDGYRITVRKAHQIEASSEEGEDALVEVLDELSRSYECMSAFHSLSTAMIASKNPKDFMIQGLQNLALLYSPQPDFIRLCISSAVIPEVSTELRKIESICGMEEAPDLARDVIELGRSKVWESVEEVVGQSEISDYQNGSCFPLIANDETLGVLVVAHRHAQPKGYSNAALSNLRTFCDLLGIALLNSNLQHVRNNEQRVLRELEIAADIQRNLLPLTQPPESPHWEVTLRHQSAYEVAGDYLESRLDRDGNLLITIIDVMGKGVSAAMLAMNYRTAFLVDREGDKSLDGFLRSTNRALHHLLGKLTMFVSCAVIRISADGRTMEVANAGHCPLLFFKPGGGIREIEATAQPLGIFEEIEPEVVKIPLEGGEAILGVTDGMYEWDFDGNWWGWENFVAAAEEQNAASDPSGFWDYVTSLARSKRRGSSQLSDDISMLLWRSLL